MESTEGAVQLQTCSRAVLSYQRQTDNMRNQFIMNCFDFSDNCNARNASSSDRSQTGLCIIALTLL